MRELTKNQEVAVLDNPKFINTLNGKLIKIKKGQQKLSHDNIFTSYYELNYTRTDEKREVQDKDGKTYDSVVFKYQDLTRK